MKYLSILFGFLCFGAVSCTIGTSLFSSNNLHDEYGKKITNAGLKQTALGRQWFSAADKALAQPQTIKLPYKETGYFPADKPTAVGLQFEVKRGEKVLVQLDKNPISSFAIYADLWQINDNAKPSLALSFDTAKNNFTYEVKKTGNLIIRLQPELLKSGNYTLTITTGPSLHFPVAGKKAHIISYFGDSRDAGKRKHEGIDIMAPFRTPAIAPADGIVKRVTENTLGGKVVFLQPTNEDYTLYYAHLNEQLVTPGQKVQQGDTVGLIGNTGNAKNTVSHLHFGIYTFNGAIDPLPFVNPVIKTPPDITVSISNLYEPYRLNRTIKTNDTLIKQQTFVMPIAAIANGYRIVLPNGEMTVVPASEIQKANKPVKQIKAKEAERLFESPDTTSPFVTFIEPDNSVSIFAYYKNYLYVQSDSAFGWIVDKGRF